MVAAGHRHDSSWLWFLPGRPTLCFPGKRYGFEYAIP